MARWASGWRWREEFPQTTPQLCWVHKTVNVLDKLPQSVQGKAKQLLHDIYLAPTRRDAEVAWERFVMTFAEKHLKAVACLTAHREELLAFYTYPAEHWPSLRSTNVIESTFATVRLRTKRTKGCGSRLATLTMVFKLVESAAKRWHRLRGYQQLPDVLNASFSKTVCASTPFPNASRSPSQREIMRPRDARSPTTFDSISDRSGRDGS